MAGSSDDLRPWGSGVRPRRGPSRSRITIYGALVANLAIAATKFAVAAITGSSAMLAEAIHSTVDTGNEVLLLIGTRLAARKPSPEFPFGHGKDVYFWSLLVAILVFGLGGGLSTYEGLTHVLEPEPMRNPGWNYLVLAASALFEGASFAIALRTFLREKAERPFWEALHASKDPTTYTVLAEDAAALAGLGVAAVGIFVATHYGAPRADGVASIVIGLILAGVAVVLIAEARGLLIGEGIRPETAAALRELVARHAIVRRVGPPLSMYVGPDDVLLTLDVAFDPDVSAATVARTVAAIEAEIRERYPRITRIFIETHAIGRGAEAEQPDASGAKR